MLNIDKLLNGDLYSTYNETTSIVKTNELAYIYETEMQEYIDENRSTLFIKVSNFDLQDIEDLYEIINIRNSSTDFSIAYLNSIVYDKAKTFYSQVVFCEITGEYVDFTFVDRFKRFLVDCSAVGIGLVVVANKYILENIYDEEVNGQ